MKVSEAVKDKPDSKEEKKIASNPETRTTYRELEDNSTRLVELVGGGRKSNENGSAIILDPPSPVPQVDVGRWRRRKTKRVNNLMTRPHLITVKSVARKPNG